MATRRAAHSHRRLDGGEPAVRARGKLDDAELARLAVAGDGDAFAELYDRHERRVYGFCMRLLGTPHDAADATQDAFVRMLARLPAMAGRELNFVAYTLACARNACYDMIEGRKRVEPSAEHPDGASLGGSGGSGGSGGASAQGEIALDPERAVLLAAAREDVRAANAELPVRQREVLALREIELLSYDEIGEIMGLNRNGVAQLVSRARIKLRDLLRGSALASVVATSPECARAQPLLANLQDEQPSERDELAWARTHLAACETCRLSRAAMEEAGVSYRALAPLVPAAWLRRAAIARAADFVGADWSNLGGTVPRATRLSRWGRRPAWMLAGAALLALCIVVVAMAGGTRDGPARSLSPQPAPANGPAIRPVAAGKHKHGPLHLAGVQGSPPPSAPDAVHVGTPSTTTASRGSTRHTAARHRRSTPRRRSPEVSSTPATTTPSPAPAPSPAVTTAPATTTPQPTPTTTTVPPAQTTPEPAPPTTTPGGSTGTTTPPAVPLESPRGSLIP